MVMPFADNDKRDLRVTFQLCASSCIIRVSSRFISHVVDGIPLILGSSRNVYSESKVVDECTESYLFPEPERTPPPKHHLSWTMSIHSPGNEPIMLINVPLK